MVTNRSWGFSPLGELFLGQSFGGLDSPEPPQFLLDMDYAFMPSDLDASFPWLHRLLLLLPIPALRHVLAARDRLQQVCATSQQLNIPPVQG